MQRLPFGWPRRRGDALPYDMFDPAREAYTARRGETIENIYHGAQERAWSGKEVLGQLVQRYGKPRLSRARSDAIQRVFAIILWGELGAWKISAQLADELVPLEARMAVTSQSFDEARHFYTMHDYLCLLGYVPKRIDRPAERVLELTLGSTSMAHKVCGMQLMIETTALTLFRTVRESAIEPVLCELLRYFEIDEARHVGLGVNYMPHLIADMTTAERLALLLFQARLIGHSLHSLWHLRDSLEVLGIDPKVMLARGKAKQFEVFRAMWSDLGVDVTSKRTLLDRLFHIVEEMAFPDDATRSIPSRARHAYQAFRADAGSFDDAFTRETTAQLATDASLPGMRKAGMAYWARRRGRHRPQDA